MGCGCCAIASDVGGNPELVQDRVTGLLFAPGDAESLASKLRIVLDDPALRNRLATAAENRARREFARSVAARRMGEIYREFIFGPDSITRSKQRET
jgi:glycosyltransferase involved in cell wall biosynthesis